MAVMLFRDSEGKDSISPKIPAKKWLSFQIDKEGKRYCLHDGRWFLMDLDYAETLRQQTALIFDRGPGLLDLPEWPAEMHGAEYNEILAKALDGICLDKNLMRSDFHKHGIEPCDVLLLQDGTYIHVKGIESSAPASHLLAQALVSTEVLTYDKQALKNSHKKIEQAGWDPANFTGKPKKIVLLVGRKGKLISAANLFTFTQVTLARHSTYLESQGITVHVAPPERTI